MTKEGLKTFTVRVRIPTKPRDRSQQPGSLELQDGTKTWVDEKNRIIIERRDGKMVALSLPK